MTSADFNNQYNRLWRGFNRRDQDLTSDRLIALFLHFGSMRLEAFESAVDLALCEARFPTLAQLDRLSQNAEDALRTKNNALRDSEAKGVVEQGFKIDPGSFGWSDTDVEIGRKWSKICFDGFDAGLSENEIDASLRVMLQSYPQEHSSKWLREFPHTSAKPQA